MAEYGRVGSAADYAKEFQQGALADTSIGMKTSILKVQERKVTTIDFGYAPFKVEQFQELARLLQGVPPNREVSVTYGEDREGSTLKVTVEI